MELEATEQLHSDLVNWTGDETPPLAELQALIWALAHDPELHDRLNALVKFERSTFEENM